MTRESGSFGFSDSSFAAVSRFEGFLEIIDAEWQQDSLSDDEIEPPVGHELTGEEHDTTWLEDEKEAPKWRELGLDVEIPASASGS